MKKKIKWLGLGLIAMTVSAVTIHVSSSDASVFF